MLFFSWERALELKSPQILLVLELITRRALPWISAAHHGALFWIAEIFKAVVVPCSKLCEIILTVHFRLYVVFTVIHL